MKILLDMNLSPEWVIFFTLNGIESIHWSEVGDIHATDQTILDWARESGYIIFTHDLDFGAILAATKMKSPSVLQFRTQNIYPDRIGKYLLEVIRKYEHLLESGSLITIDIHKSRIRILPL